MILIGGIAVFIVLVVVVLLGRVVYKPAATVNTDTGLLNYTNSITGQVAEDKPDENTPPVNGILNAPTANILGYEATNTYLSPNQSSSLQTALINFLMAHSGLSSVTAGIKDAAVSQQSDGTIAFTLVTIRPQASYAVTAKLDNTYNLVQSVTFKRVN